MMAKTTLFITGELLRDLLHLPTDTVITGSQESSAHTFDGRDDYVAIYVEHHDIPDGTRLVLPTFRRQPDGTVVFQDWGAQS